MVRSNQIRTSNEFQDVINTIRSDFIRCNKIPPPTSKICDMILNRKIRKDKGVILYDKTIFV